MMDPAEETLVCPYNRAHAILKSRMQFHLPRCRAQYPNMEKKTCPYNSTHVINHVEMEMHKQNCPDRKVVDSFIYAVGENKPPVGLQPVRSFNVNVVSDEDWDDEGPGVSVLDQVREGVLHKNVLINNKIGAPKAERRANRFNERLRYQAVSSGNPQFLQQDQARPSTSNNVAPVREDKLPKSSVEPESQHVEEAREPNYPPPKSTSSSLYESDKSVNSSDFPVLEKKSAHSEVTEKMSDLDVGNLGNNNKVENGEERPVPPPNAWGKPLARNQNEKITWPTQSPRAPTSPGFRSSSAAQPVHPPRPTMPYRAPSSPWATNVNQQRNEPGPSAHLAPGTSAPSRNVVVAAANPAVNGIWARGIAFNNSQARMTSDDFPTLLPISSTSRGRRGGNPRP